MLEQLPYASLVLPAALRWAWRTFWVEAGLYLAIDLTLLAAWAVLEIIVIAGQALGTLFNLTAHLVFLLVFAGLCAGFTEICLRAAQGERPAYRALFSRFKLGPAMLAAQLLYLVGIFLGLVPLVLPGLLVAVYFAFYGLYLSTGQANPLAALRDSVRLTHRRGLFVSGALLVLLLLNLFGAMLLGVGLLVTVPVSGLTLTALYSQLVRAQLP
jgi:hypothetical protein